VPIHHDTIGVAVIEPQALVCEALRALLERDAALTVVATVSTSAEMLTICRTIHVDVVVLSVEPTAVNPEAALSELVTGLPHGCRLLVLTSDPNPALLASLIGLGAMGVVSKDETGDVLGRAIQRVHSGMVWIDQSQLTAVVTGVARRRADGNDRETVKVESLTAREREVVTLVADGLTNAQIGNRLFISEITVRNHLTSILSKLDVPDRFRLAVYAFKHGLVLYPATAAMRRMAATMKDRPLRRPDRQHATPRRRAV
jgi:DNA-binding NarL/FixJ family response regulator